MSLGNSDAIRFILFSKVMVFPPQSKKLRLALENAYETRSPKVPCHSPKLQIQHCVDREHPGNAWMTGYPEMWLDPDRS